VLKGFVSGSYDRGTLEGTVLELFESEHINLHNALVGAIMAEAHYKGVARAPTIIVTPRLELLLLCASGLARVFVCYLVPENRGTKYALARTAIFNVIFSDQFARRLRDLQRFQ